jgi:hypothetical protein
MSQLNCPAHIIVVASHKAGLAERMHPLGQIMEVLAIPIPFQPFIQRFIGVAFLKRFADPQAARCRMMAPSLFIKSADPSAAAVVLAISPEDLGVRYVLRAVCSARVIRSGSMLN